MKRPVALCLLVLSCLGSRVLFCQEPSVRVGGTAAWFAPVGALSVRFLPTVGGSVHFALKRGVPQWGGSIEYFKFHRENIDKLFITRTLTDSLTGAQNTFRFPLQQLSMSLEMIGVAANGSYELWNNEFIETRFCFGFGVYHWKGARSSYYDSVKVQMSKGPVLVEVLRVPENQQEDWSGGLNVGAEVSLRILSPLSLNLGGRYRIIVGELWPALALDIENVSSFQMVELRAGFSVDF